jgi:VIT1/CCC1 family predicted Fe2+/Mn2+ transporter
MKCFNHEEKDSVGMCRFCGKAVCKECAADGAIGITCKGECATKASGMNDRLAQAQRAQGMVKKFSGYFALIMGALILLMAFFVMSGEGAGLIKYIIMVPGIALVIWGVFLIRKNRK